MLPPVEVRDVGFAPVVAVEPTARFVAVELARGRLVVLEVVDFLAGELDFPTSGLVTASDLDSSPDKRAASTGVWGGGISVSGADSEGSSATDSTAGASAAVTSTSSGAGATGSSVFDMVHVVAPGLCVIWSNCTQAIQISLHYWKRTKKKKKKETKKKIRNNHLMISGGHIINSNIE